MFRASGCASTALPRNGRRKGKRPTSRRCKPSTTASATIRKRAPSGSNCSTLRAPTIPLRQAVFAGSSVRSRTSTRPRTKRALVQLRPLEAQICAIILLMRKLLLRRGNVLHPEDGNIASGCDVLIEDKHITQVGPNLPTPADAEIVDVEGMTVMPGLIDCHVHVVASTADIGANSQQPA